VNIWVLNALLIEAMAIVGTVGVVLTRRTGMAFLCGFNTMLPVTVVYILNAPALGIRQVIILVMVLIYLAHMNWLLLFQGKHTAVAKLDAQLPLFQKYLLPIVLTNAAGWVYCLPFYFGTRRASPLGMEDHIAVLVYLAGTLMHFLGDYQKQRFKAKEESRGKLLKTGLWRMCRHPNYFGDLLVYVAFAIIGGSLWGWVAPVLNFAQYRFDAIPKNEQWAREHYGKQWEEYSKGVKMFIPYIY